MSKFNSFFGFEKIGEVFYKERARIHFSGVGGVGMYSLFRLCALSGKRTSGSDREISERAEKLIKEGCDVKKAPYLSAVSNADMVVYSLALDEMDAEIKCAEEMGKPVVSRAEFLGFLASSYENKISVSGSHGKSSTTALLGAALEKAGFCPTVVCGASLPSGEPFVFGKKDYIVMEACEYKDSFLSLHPDFAVFLNLELDHTDYFKTLDDIKRSFLASIKSARVNLVNSDDENLADITKDLCGIYTFGINAPADYRAVNLLKKDARYSFTVEYKGISVAEVSLSVYGIHSVYNALAAFSMAHILGADPKLSAEAISTYSGIERRFEIIKNRENGAPIIYDYAHHPSEIKATLSAMRDLWQGDFSVVFKPHTYTRTKDLFEELVIALADAPRVYISEIDGIREKAIEGVSAASLAKATGANAKALSDEEIIERIKSEEGAVLIMGASPLEKIKSAVTRENKKA